MFHGNPGEQLPNCAYDTRTGPTLDPTLGKYGAAGAEANDLAAA